MRILLLGCNGQVGSLIKKTFKENTEFLPLNRSELDITNEYSINEVISSFKPKVIINAAAYTEVDNAEHNEEKAFVINGLGPKYLAKAANSHRAALIHISTDYVFEGDKEEPYLESDQVNPQSVYGKSKLEGEVAIKEYCSKHIIIRTSWVFARNGHNFVNTMLRLGKEKPALNIVGDQFGGPTYAGDIANLVSVIVGKIENGENINWGLYHYSGLPHISWHGFAEVIFIKAKGHNFLKTIPKINHIETKDFFTPAKRPKNSRLDCKKIQVEFDIYPSDWVAELDNIGSYAEIDN